VNSLLLPKSPNMPTIGGNAKRLAATPHCLQVQQAALDFLTVAEPRLMLMALPPSADAGQPLTLGSLLELQRALYLATQVGV
jgi:hypothetical protein